MHHLQFPIGEFEQPETITPRLIRSWINIIERFPEILAHELGKIPDFDLKQAYRPGGWTGNQVVHHLADSHLNAFIRFKLALTEDNPTIKPYREELFAELADYRMTIEASLPIIRGVHLRWRVLLENMTEADFQKTYTHPQYEKVFKLDEALALYAWHCQHHLAHIQLLGRKW